MFDFVSPFDAFAPPKTRSNAGSVSAVNSSVGHTAPTSPVKAPSTISPAPVSAVYSPPPALSPALVSPPVVTPPAVAQLDQVRSRSPANKQVQAVRTHSRKASASSPPQSVASPAATPTAATPNTKGKNDLGLPWLVGKVAKNAVGSGPKSLAPGSITIDLSKPNVDALINAPGTVQVTPMTIMKAENIGFHRGRTVASTKGWVAYTLSRGRVRLIERNSGARTVLQLEATGPILDIAATAGGLAVVASDGSVAVFTVPTSWERDDPTCPLIFYLGPIDDDSVPETLGDVNHVEWVRRPGTNGDSLAIGGTEGVIIVRPADYAEQPSVDAREIMTANKVLKTNGPLVSFCLNSTHQAIGLLSTSSHFCLYSVLNLNRVWNRQLPSNAHSLPPSSVHFCEANILVGRANDTHFDLVQITIELAILSSIQFVAPKPSPAALDFAHAEYDTERSTLIVVPFARGSAFTFRYALKGQAPLRYLHADTSGVTAFDSMAELPLDSVLSFVAGANTDGDVELFYSTPTGISQASIDKDVFGGAVTPVKPAPAVPEPKVKNEKKKDKKDRAAPAPVAAPVAAPVTAPVAAPVAAPVPAPAPASPVTPVVATVAAVSVVEVDEGTATPPPVVAAAAAPAAAGISSDEFTKALKKTEDKLSNLIKQTVSNELKTLASRLDADKNLVASVNSSIGEHLKQHLPAIVSDEFKRVPIQAEVRSAVSAHAPAAIEQSLQGVSRDIERAIAPVVPRTIATVVQPAVEHAVHDAVQTILVPALSQATTRVYDQLVSDLKSEMLHIRKDVNADQGDALKATNAMIHSMASSVSELQQQVSALSKQLAKFQAAAPAPTSSRDASAAPPASFVSAPAPPAPIAPIGTHPALSLLSPPVQAAPAPALVAPALPPNLEDTFLTALQRQTTGATLQLVHDNAPRTDQILPLPPSKSPLSQAVLIALVHRVALALAEVPPHEPIFQTAAMWERRAVVLIDARDPSIAGYLPRVVPVVTGALQQVVNSLSRMPDPMSQAHVGVLRGTLEVINSKL